MNTIGYLVRIAVAVLAMWSVNAGAALVNFSGNCTTACAALGLPAGGGVSAEFDVGNLADLTNLTLSKTDVSSFSIALGNIAFDELDTTNWDFVLTTDGSGAVTSFQFLASFGTSVANLGDSVDLRSGVWFAAHDGVCFNGVAAVPCDFSQTTIYGYIGDSAVGTSQVQITQVPEPAPLILMASMLAGLMLSRRRVR